MSNPKGRVENLKPLGSGKLTPEEERALRMFFILIKKQKNRFVKLALNSQRPLTSCRRSLFVFCAASN